MTVHIGDEKQRHMDTHVEDKNEMVTGPLREPFYVIEKVCENIYTPYPLTQPGPTLTLTPSPDYPIARRRQERDGDRAAQETILRHRKCL